jgi:phosphoglycerate dehydrogenase-like enzyme
LPHSPSIIVSLSERELAFFFPGQLEARLRGLLSGAHWIDPLRSQEDWTTTLQQLRPGIIVSGWHTPPIPAYTPDLRFVCHVAGSVRRHVPRELLERGVVVGNWGDTVAETVAEGALSMILASLRRIQYFGDLMHRQKGWQWAPAGALSLYERKVGIHGFGMVVRRLLPLLKPFRCSVRIFTTGVPDRWYAEHGVERAESLEKLFEWADVLVEAEALTPTNRGIIGEALLRRLRPHGLFVNIARGALVDEPALARIAKEGALRVALDVFQAEPLAADSPLRDLPEVVLTPHVAGPTEDRAHLCGAWAVENLTRSLGGEPIRSPVTLDIYDRST